TQVHVEVDEAGADDLAGRIEHLGVGRHRQILADALDAIALEQHVVDAVHRAGRIDDVAVPDQEAHACAPFAPARSSKTPMGPATVTVMPSLRMPWMLERATRLWAMSPTMATLSPSKWPLCSRMVSRSSSACVGCS